MRETQLIEVKYRYCEDTQPGRQLEAL